MTRLDFGTSLHIDGQGWAQLWCANQNCVDDFAVDNGRPAVLCGMGPDGDDEALSRSLEQLDEIARAAGWVRLNRKPPAWLCPACTNTHQSTPRTERRAGLTQQNPHRAAASPHSPNEIHLATNGHVGEGSPLVGHACRECSPPALIRDLDDGELIDTDQVVWWPCQHAQS